ncbi:YdbL family protein [Novosphingobium lentum]|uniref:YdbL family protein n=1 Tax=Novosphingobium lentum TaxID=145287 RepID=UPI00082C6A42|nr:YdbL family protein [Novosphingobium lentum]
MTGFLNTTFRRKLALGGLGAALLLGAAVPVLAQGGRDPAYAAARAAGQVGEKMDGYLGYVSTPSAALRAVVEDVNIKRKAVYAEKAQANHATVEEYALTSGCLLIRQTSPGEKYQAPDGSWQTRTSAPPLRDSRCP